MLHIHSVYAVDHRLQCYQQHPVGLSTRDGRSNSAGQWLSCIIMMHGPLLLLLTGNRRTQCH
ncbi:hypothetical protein BDW71DRAFT_172530 [Aspergillus fruticulosus]